ncbi:MAG: helix-turn-helix transcriptional regulator [Robiginitomaculum sp.]|nr:helix-turn-helix transcriptional regulator [Robiginitomaculum sp.]
MLETENSTCPVARTLKIIGHRWTPLILRELLLHKTRRFADMQISLTGIAPTTLSARLKTLEQHGIVERKFYSQHPPRAEYVLTAKGRSLGPIINAMRKWGREHTKPEE